ncbi:MAG: putative selenate reductase subunit YgfK [Spirochaetales bacterium]|nr:putative selenate reductase subunit YgfK [Spirochaetales bacterium]
MGDKMRLVGLTELLERVFEEYKAQGTIMDIHESSWYRKMDERGIDLLGETCGTVLGPAAGPHTQLAMNILTSYLTGSRFIELKTVQILDSLEIDKPCIDACDEGFNTEWSTELSLTEAWMEYAKAWILLHLIEELFGFKKGPSGRSFIFNMSVGYDLEGIKTDRMQQYLRRMKDSGDEQQFTSWIGEMVDVASRYFPERAQDLRAFADKIPAKICGSVTLSTMHGCPPHEIESICSYMLTEQKLDTYVKLNPTLLGFDRVREILDELGYGYVDLDPEGFSHDLQYIDAIPMLTRLREVAAHEGLTFGVKLTNTLGCANNRNALPGDEMYMSGRALFPLSINLAAQLSEHFGGDLPISYSGGITIHNVKAVFETGIRPITMATDLLKPGGYLRQAQMARAIEEIDQWDREGIDVEALKALARRALSEETITKEFRGTDEVRSPGPLPVFDCYEAPCVTACAIGQHIPEYIRLVGEGRYGEALETIYERNALPSMTGNICDHQCQLVCTRLDYEGCINIREVKKLAVLHGMEEYKTRWRKPEVSRDAKVAVVGAGPAGLSAAYFLVREGFSVTVFEREKDAGGIVQYVVPHFRISREAIASDVDHIRDQGVEFVFSVDETFGLTDLKARGYDYIVLGLGSYQNRTLPIEGPGENMVASLPFLTQFNRDSSKLRMGKRVVVIGAGDTAMDCARSALRCPGVEEATIVYRRAFEQMPASREEYEDAIEENVAFKWLRNPERFEDGELTVRVMELGEVDASGRRRPVPTDTTETLKVDSVVYAIGDDPDAKLLEGLGFTVNSRGKVATREGGETESENVFLIGDSRTGTSTVVRCIAEGRRASDAICVKEEAGWERVEALPFMDPDQRNEQIRVKKEKITAKPNARTDYVPAAFGRTELSRCLECDYICNKCVDVCPNRANLATPVSGEALFSNPYEIVHVDAYCNECGNCGNFCPWEGRPYIDKPTVFSTAQDFANSENPGWLIEGDALRYRQNGTEATMPLAELPQDEHFFRLFTIVHESRPHLFGPVLEEVK